MDAPSIGFARLPKSGLIELRARYGGRVGAYLLDSAAGWDVINRAEHPIEFGEELEEYGVEVEGEWIGAATLEGEEFRLGHFVHTPEQVLAVELPYRASTGTPIQGMLGHPLFMESPIGINWTHQILTFGPLPPASPVLAELPLTISDRQATLHADIAGIPLEMRLETGASFSLMIEKADFDLERFVNPEEVDLPPVVGRPIRFSVARVHLGDLVIEEAKAIYELNPKAPAEGRIGLGLLSRYNLWIDYPGERLVLLRR